MNYIIATLGCKVNQYESEAMDLLLRSHGHAPAPAGTPADAVLLNSCAVTAEGERKARQTLRRLKAENPAALLCVCGCWSQLKPEAARELGAAVIYGTGNRAAFVAAVEEAFARRSAAPAAEEKAPAVVSTETEPDFYCHRNTRLPLPFEELPSGAYAGHARAYLKIQDGCDNYCTYCIIPYTRGRICSLPVEKCAAEYAALADKGYKEIVLTGIEIASYGRDLPDKPSLKDACLAMAAAAPGVRMHLGSLEPRIITPDFVEVLKGVNLCPHFHLSLQSGCDATLHRMNRRYTTERFYKSVELLRGAFPNAAITTDVITGFPGETEAEFEETLAFLRRCAFAAAHVFPYSVRPGTPAAKMPGAVPQKEMAARAARASAVAEETGAAFLDSLRGETLQALFETEKDGFCFGHTENYCELRLPGTGLRNNIIAVKITGREGKILTGLPL